MHLVDLAAMHCLPPRLSIEQSYGEPRLQILFCLKHQAFVKPLKSNGTYIYIYIHVYIYQSDIYMSD